MASMRQLVSYDDIASQVSAKADPLPAGGPGPPPKKRRKNNHRQGQRRGGHHPQNRDDVYEDEGETPPRKARIDYGLEEESRQLTHDEVWDDSALIRAWDAAMEEYKVLNGVEKKWKSEPVNKSPLWYNIPPESEVPPKSSPGPSFLMPSIPAAFTSEVDFEQGEDDESIDPDNSHPVNFDTFVPRHDPSLPDAKHGVHDNLRNDTTGTWRGIVPPAPPGLNPQVTSNEAFERAIGAWYWAGYWTGVYHSGVKKVPQNSETHDHDHDHDRKLEAVDEALVGNIEQKDQEAPSEQIEDADLIPT